MELARRQAAIARLLVDAGLRKLFVDSPADAAATLGITPAQAELLAETVDGLPQFARSLMRKRLGEARRLLPHTAEMLGSQFDEEFLRYAAAYPSEGLRRHERDALALAERLRPSLDGPALEALEYETGWVEARMGRRLVLRRPRRGSLALWLRVGGRIRHGRFGWTAGWTNRALDAQESK